MSQVRCCPAWDLWHPGQRCEHCMAREEHADLVQTCAGRHQTGSLHRALLNSQHILQAHILSASLKRIKSPAKSNSHLRCLLLLTPLYPYTLPYEQDDGIHAGNLLIHLCMVQKSPQLVQCATTLCKWFFSSSALLHTPGTWGSASMQNHRFLQLNTFLSIDLYYMPFYSPSMFVPKQS